MIAMYSDINQYDRCFPGFKSMTATKTTDAIIVITLNHTGTALETVIATTEARAAAPT
jgi:carbon monoxide dehydrogenase subunit G